MKQEVTAGKILVELLDAGIVDEEHEWIVYTYLIQAWAVGYDAGSKSRSNQKPVVQYRIDGQLVDVFDSAAAAARKTKIGHSEIARCASGKRGAKTAGGYIWKYINIHDPTSSEPPTVGSFRSKQSPPKQ